MTKSCTKELGRSTFLGQHDHPVDAVVAIVPGDDFRLTGRVAQVEHPDDFVRIRADTDHASHAATVRTRFSSPTIVRIGSGIAGAADHADGKFWCNNRRNGNHHPPVAHDGRIAGTLLRKGRKYFQPVLLHGFAFTKVAGLPCAGLTKTMSLGSRRDVD